MIISQEVYKEKVKGKIFYISPSSIKSSDLISPKAIKYNMEHRKPSTPQKEFGTILGYAIMEPEKFKSKYALLTLAEFGDDPKLNKDGSINKVDAFNKSIFSDFAAKNEGKTILEFSVADAILACKKSVEELEDFNMIFRPDHAYIETTFLAFAEFDTDHNFIAIRNMEIDEYTAMMEHEKILFLPVLTRIDFGDKIGRWLGDLKSCNSIEPKDFSKDCLTYGYHIQAAMEMDIVNAALNITDENDKYNTFYFVCVQNNPPYDAVYFMPTSMAENDTRMKFIEAGRVDYITKLEWVQEARITGKWEGISKFSPYKTRHENGSLLKNRQIIEIDLPRWYYMSNLNLL